MRASEVLQKCLSDSLSGMHALRQRALLRAVEALLHGGRLTLIDLARAWPGATRVRAPLKACDRLLCNRALQVERSAIEQDMAHWLLRGDQPVIVIDWSDLKPDKSWCLLRAAVPIGGRTLLRLNLRATPSQQLGYAYVKSYQHLSAEERAMLQIERGAVKVCARFPGF